MKQEIIVRVFDVIGSPLAVSSDDGQKVYDKIAPLLREGRHVRLSFEKIETMISAFLNAAIGQFYGEFTANATFFAQKIMNMCSRHDHPFTRMDLAQMLLDVGSGQMDPNDRLLIESCRLHGWKFVTNDADCSEGGIEVLTTNPKLIAACP